MKKIILGISSFLMMSYIGYQLNASTVNGIANQIISGFTNHGVLVGTGNNTDISVVAPGGTGLPLVSQGSSVDPAYVALGNSALTNSSVTINTSGCLGGGGSVSLGAALTLTSSTCGGWSGVTNNTAGASPTWVLASGDIKWTLSTNATATVTVAGGDQWVHHTVQICQPGAGGPYTLAWPSNVKGGMTIGTTTSKCSMQMFVSYDGTNLYAVDQGVINQ